MVSGLLIFSFSQASTQGPLYSLCAFPSHMTFCKGALARKSLKRSGTFLNTSHLLGIFSWKSSSPSVMTLKRKLFLWTSIPHIYFFPTCYKFWNLVTSAHGEPPIELHSQWWVCPIARRLENWHRIYRCRVNVLLSISVEYTQKATSTPPPRTGLHEITERKIHYRKPVRRGHWHRGFFLLLPRRSISMCSLILPRIHTW